jgi:hypothetical protein
VQQSGVICFTCRNSGHLNWLIEIHERYAAAPSTLSLFFLHPPQDTEVLLRVSGGRAPQMMQSFTKLIDKQFPFHLQFSSVCSSIAEY